MHPRPITIFTPSFADGTDTNAQNLTVKELVARLPPERFHVTMSVELPPDPRIATRPNTRLIPYTRKGNALRLLRHCLFAKPDIYFFPRCGPLDRGFFDLRRRLRIKTVLVSYVVMMMNDKTRDRLLERSVEEADVVCSNSRFVAQSIHREFGRESVIMHDGVDTRFYFPPASQRTGGVVKVLYAGSFSPRKRPELVIEQARRWPHVEFRLAGKGSMEDHCRRLCQQLGCGNVCFLGHLSSAQLGEEMRQADVFLFPSVIEGHPQVLIQAAACGLPIVAMDTYQPDCVLDGRSGFLASTDEELATRLALLLTNPDLRTSMSATAVIHSRNFNWDRIAEEWANLFRQVVDDWQKLSLVQSDVGDKIHA
jgi:glycosyltransferase involved in cell wall biosynthesis